MNTFAKDIICADRLMNSKAVHCSDNKILLSVLLIITNTVSFSQKTEPSVPSSHFGGAITVTNNGISFIPNFTLGKPAAIFDLNMSRGRLSFEPQFRFALEGKPWSFIFWWRYKLIQGEKLKLNIGAHPAVVFVTLPLSTDSITQAYIVARRYLAAEIAPSYFLTKDINVGLYYLYGYGIEKDVVKSTHMVSARVNFTNIRITKQFYFRFNPQVYYLKMDEKDGFYVSGSLTLASRNFPVSLSSLINQSITTEIPANHDLLWNVSLIYSFGSEYVKK